MAPAPLEGLAFAGSLFCDTGSRSLYVEGADLPQDVVLRKQELEKEYDRVVDEIHNVPGYEDFLRMMPFSRLQSAAQEGPVIVLMTICGGNVAALPDDGVSYAVIILDSQDPVVITLGGGRNLEEDIENISSSLSKIRKMLKSNDSKAEQESNDTMLKVLNQIGSLFVKDVVEALQSRGIKKHSRIWWCPTSKISAFPIHAAMWPYQAEDGKTKTRCLADIYTSSYTPSLDSTYPRSFN